MLELAFMVFALGFFTFAIKMVFVENDKDRKTTEQRETWYQTTIKDKNAER